MSIIVPSNHTRIGAWVNSKTSGRNSPVYCTSRLIAMQGYQTKTEDTISLDYNSICYITSRIGWVSMKGVFKYTCRRDPGKLYNNYLKKNQSTPRPSEHPPVMGGKMSKRLGGIKGCKYKTSSWHSNRFPDADNIGLTV